MKWLKWWSLGLAIVAFALVSAGVVTDALRPEWVFGASILYSVSAFIVESAMVCVIYGAAMRRKPISTLRALWLALLVNFYPIILICRMWPGFIVGVGPFCQDKFNSTSFACDASASLAGTIFYLVPVYFLAIAAPLTAFRLSKSAP